MPADFPSVAELVPHSGPMLLVKRVLEHSADRTVCEVDPAESGPFLDEGIGVPTWVGLEYMAQCAAVHGGLLARRNGEPPRAGLLLGTRRLKLATDRFRPGELLRVSVSCVHPGAQMLSFAGEVRGAAGNLLAEARFNVYMLENSGQTES